MNLKVKEFKFEHDGMLKVERTKNNGLSVWLQGRHLDGDFKITSTHVVLDAERVAELILWLTAERENI